MASSKQTALAKARQRRVALDQDRAARDNRVEQAAAQVFVLLEQRAAAEQAAEQANAGIGQSLRELMEEGITLDGVAELCDLDVADVRRLVKAAPPKTEAGTVTPLRASASSRPSDGAIAADEVPDAARRAE